MGVKARVESQRNGVASVFSSLAAVRAHPSPIAVASGSVACAPAPRPKGRQGGYHLMPTGQKGARARLSQGVDEGH